MPKEDKADPELAGVKLTSPGKILFPEAKITKEELARYLLAVSRPHARTTSAGAP